MSKGFIICSCYVLTLSEENKICIAILYPVSHRYIYSLLFFPFGSIYVFILTSYNRGKRVRIPMRIILHTV